MGTEERQFESGMADKKEDNDVTKIGVAITTQNREDVTRDSLRRWRALIPKGSVLVVVDDGSAVPSPYATFRFENSVGIARAKNKCFELLEDEGVTDYFLADNDLYPTSKDWWKPYVESPEPHLSYQFLDLVGPVKLHDMAEIYRDEKHVAYTGQRGCLLYYKQICLDTVGGFDPTYGRALYEHSDLANRIHAAGLTSWRNADVAGSARLFHSMDEYVQVNRTIAPSEQESLLSRNANLHSKRKNDGYQAFVPYRISERQREDVIITSMLTTNPDPQRGFKWDPDPGVLTNWLESVERGGYRGVVLADELKELRGYSAEVVHVLPSKMNVYYQRWLHIYQYLRDHPEIRKVWCTDGTDVEVLRDPFDGMAMGKVYVGAERAPVGNQWMMRNHPARVLLKFISENKTKTLLNAGVIGSDRDTMMLFAQKMITTYGDIESERFFGSDKSRKDVGDMAAFNRVAYEYFGSSLVYGPEVTTDFKAYKDNGTARFKHK